METSSSELDHHSTSDQNETDSLESRRLCVERCIESLIHANQCTDANCSLNKCQQMKSLVQHARSCKIDTHCGCATCKKLIILCCYHAKLCQDQEGICLVPYCLNIKHKLRKLELQQSLEVQTLEQQSTFPQNYEMSEAVPQPIPGNSNSSRPSSPSAQSQ